MDIGNSKNYLGIWWLLNCSKIGASTRPWFTNHLRVLGGKRHGWARGFPGYQHHSSFSLHHQHPSSRRYLRDCWHVCCVSTPPCRRSVHPKLHFSKYMGPAMDRPERYRTLIGTLLHLANCTRPDISFAVDVLPRYSLSPCHTQWKIALGFLRYCSRTYSLHTTPRVYHNNIFSKFLIYLLWSYFFLVDLD